MNNTMIAQTYLPHQFVDPRKLNFRMNPYEMANQQAQMQQIFLRQQMQQRYVSRKRKFVLKFKILAEFSYLKNEIFRMKTYFRLISFGRY